MKLKDWRAEKGISQAKLAQLLCAYAGKKLAPRTIGHWELGGMPRRFWRDAVREYTGGRVRANDFAADNG